MKCTWYRNTRAVRMDSKAEFRRQLILTEPTSALVTLQSLSLVMKDLWSSPLKYIITNLRLPDSKLWDNAAPSFIILKL